MPRKLRVADCKCREPDVYAVVRESELEHIQTEEYSAQEIAKNTRAKL